MFEDIFDEESDVSAIEAEELFCMEQKQLHATLSTSVLLYNIIIFIYIIHIYVSYTYFTVYIVVCVLMRPWSLMSCVCVCVCVYICVCVCVCVCVST